MGTSMSSREVQSGREALADSAESAGPICAEPTTGSPRRLLTRAPALCVEAT